MNIYPSMEWFSSLRSQRSKKWSICDHDILPAWIAEMDFPLAPEIIRELSNAIHRAETGYIPMTEVHKLQESCRNWLQRNFGFQVRCDQIQLVPDVLRGIELAIHTFSPPGSGVILTTPAYHSFFEVVSATGRRIYEVPMVRHRGKFTFNIVEIENALRDGAGSLLLCNPYNPLGRVFTRDELKALSNLIEKYGARVISDEIHAPIVYAPHEHIPYATVSHAAALHSVALISAAKGWNIGGLKCAQMVITNDHDLAEWESLTSYQVRGASILGILANRAAYEHSDDWMAHTVEYLHGNRDLLVKLVAEKLPAVRMDTTEGTYLAWLDCRDMHLGNPASAFLDRGRVMLSDGAAFGKPGIGFVRLNFATSRKIITAMITQMSSV